MYHTFAFVVPINNCANYASHSACNLSFMLDQYLMF